MRLLRMAGMFAAVAVLCMPCAAADAEQLLSRNATYRVWGAGNCYTGSVMPGVNMRAPRETFVYTPLVEQTDTGDLLIDGDSAGKTMVYTPWSWSYHWKLILVEMKLPGPSKVSRVDVYLPAAVAYQPESVTVFVRGGSGAWGKVASIFSESGPRDARVHTRKLTFDLNKVACQDLKIVCSDDSAASGVSEIEVWGQGPIEPQPSEFNRAVIGMSQERGLIRSKPHLETFTAPTPQVPDGSVLLTKAGGTNVKLSGDTATGGTGQMLVDADRTTVLRVDKPPHSHFSLTADLELPARHLIDAVNIWMPGGQGRQTGHVHDLTVAIGDGEGDSAVWQTPVDLVVNPYWPGDDAPKPYVIPIDGLNVPGRRVRVTATLMGVGGVTNRLALAEIEVWGRPAGDAAATLVRLDKRPVELERRPIGELHPKWKWLRSERVRGAWMGDNLWAKFAGTEKTKADVLKEAGFNLILTMMGPDRKDLDVSTSLTRNLPGNVKESQRVGVPLLIIWQYGSAHQEPYRKYRAQSGYLHERSCCPLDEQYIDRHIGRWAVAVASGGADGILVDTEMYESDQPNYSGACVCDDCFATYLKEFADGWRTLYEQLLPERRGLWLNANEANGHYGQYQNRRIAALYDTIRQRCQAINPAFIFAHAPGTRHLSIIMRGLGTSSLPCLAFSEYEYSLGFGKRSYSEMERIRQEGIPALYLVGQFLVPQTPELVSHNGLLGSLYCDGWWAYYAEAILTHPDADDPEAFHGSYGRVRGTSARDYLDAIKAMHQRLDEELEKPRDRWPRSAVIPVPPNSDYELGRHKSFNEIGKKRKVDLVFLGDSITHGWEGGGRQVWSKYYGKRNAANFGIGGDKTQHVLWRIDHGNFDNVDPKLVVILIGINNGAGNTAPEIAEGVAAIVQRLSNKVPNAKLLLLGILPFGKGTYLNAANPMIEELADGKMIHYLNIDQSFLDERGKIRPDLMPDYLHLSPQGYQVWAEAIEDKVVDLLGEPSGE